MKTTLKQFLNENFTNKFNFIPGKVYSFDELPNHIKNDIEVQFEEYSELGPTDYNYVAKLIKKEDLEEYLTNVFGEYDIGDAIDHPYMKKLIKKIKNEGLDYPAVGIEGNHRALAFYVLGWDLPYLEMIENENNY